MARKTIDETGREVAPAPARTHAPATAEAVAEAALALVLTVPEAPDADGSEIFARLLSAETLDDLQSTDGPLNGPDVVGRRLKVLHVHRRPAEFDGPVPWYLIVDSEDVRTGERVTWSTSSLGLMIPLCKVVSWGALPAIVEVQESDKPTKAGYRPLNMVVKAASGAPVGNNG